MDFSLTKKQIDLVQLVREVVAKRLKELFWADSNQGFDWRMVKILAEHNLICPTIPLEYGGLGLNRLTTALVIEEVAAACPSAAAIIDATLHAVEPLLLAASDQQKDRFLPGLTGENAGLAAFALTEAAGGSDLSLISTLARKTDNGFSLNGSKDFVINAPVADFIAVIATTSREKNKASMRVVLVPKNTKGLVIGQKRFTCGLDQVEIAEIIFQNVNVGAENVIRANDPGSGYLLLTQTFDLGRALVGATSVGIARAAYQAALEHAENRIQFGTKIKNHQAIAFSLADMATKIEMARLLTWKACWLMDEGGDYSVASAMAKVASSTIAQEVTTIAADIFGARGYEKGNLVEQLVRDARALSTIEGTNHMQRLVIASQL